MVQWVQKTGTHLKPLMAMATAAGRAVTYHLQPGSGDGHRLKIGYLGTTLPITAADQLRPLARASRSDYRGAGRGMRDDYLLLA